MPRNQGNKVAPAAELGDDFDLAAALLVRCLDEFSRFLEVASLCVAARPCRGDGGIIPHRRLASSGRGRQAHQIASGVG